MTKKQNGMNQYQEFKNQYAELVEVVLQVVDEWYLETTFEDYSEVLKEHFSEGLKETIKENMLADQRLFKSLLYAQLSRANDHHWQRVRSMLGDRVFHTSSEIGGVLVGNEAFNVCIPNGYGDGITRVAVFNRDEHNAFNEYMMDSIPVALRGKFNIYNYDCSTDPDDIAMVINGIYAVYNYESMVAFVEM